MAASSIFITGAASGIGRLTAQRFAREGWRIGAFDIDAAGLDTLRAELGEDRCLTGRLDVTDRDQFAGAIEAFGAWTGGRMDVLFNNAGILQQGRFDAIPLDLHLKTIDVNVRGVVIGTYLALPLLKATPGACILSMCSASAVYGTPDHSVYSATKFAVRSLTESLDFELGEAGIRVVDLMPSFVATPMVLDQENPSPMVANMGIAHQPDEIAEWAWRAVHGRRVHWMTFQLRMLDILGALFPGVARSVFGKFTKPKP
jgi:NAD(P)-dependent dehydrogenase (short-subunit alcohol dehydrogenase family)